MTSPAEWVTKGLAKHNSVESAHVVNGDCVEIHRKHDYPTVTVRVADTRVDVQDLDRIGLTDVDAMVTTRRNDPYTWPAKIEAFNRGHDLYSNREFWYALGCRVFVGSETSDIHYFVDRIGGHDKVARLERVGESLFRVHRNSGLGSIVVYCADEYILSEEFVRGVLARFPLTQIIANLSSWNKITPEAIEEGVQQDCQVLDLSGIYGALNKAV